jgi:hypothetical protein
LDALSKATGALGEMDAMQSIARVPAKPLEENPKPGGGPIKIDNMNFSN